MKTTILKSVMLVLVALFSLSVNAQDAQIDGIYYNLDQAAKTAEVTNLAGGGRVRYSYSGEIVIPASIEFEGATYSVTSIGANAFYNGSSLISVTIPNSVTTIGEEAFSQSGLSSITIPNSVVTIGKYAFNQTPWLNNQEDGVVYAGNVVYWYKGTMPENTNITIKEGTTSICANAFFNCKNLTSIEIPNSVTSIGESAFQECKNLTSIDIPNSVTFIGASAFDDTAWLENQEDGVVYADNVVYKYKGTMPENTSIVIKEGTTFICPRAFYGCKNLASVEIPNSVTAIGFNAFQSCWNLHTVTIPNNITSIENGTFFGSGLTSIDIPNSVTSIGTFAFAYCSNLTSIEIPNSVTSIGDQVFENCI